MEMSLLDSVCLVCRDVRHRNKDHKSINTYLWITNQSLDTVKALEIQTPQGALSPLEYGNVQMM